MRKNALVGVLLLSLIMFDVSDASFVLKLRKLVAPDPKDNKPKDQNPVEVKKGSPHTDRDGSLSPVPQPQPHPLPKVGSEHDDKKESDGSVPPVSVPPPKKDDEGDKGQKEGDEKKFSHSSTTETCEGHSRCKDEGHMHACISKIGTPRSALLLAISLSLINQWLSDCVFMVRGHSPYTIHISGAEFTSKTNLCLVLYDPIKQLSLWMEFTKSAVSQ